MENTDANDASSLLVPDVNEDSVDIYDGLDVGFSSNAEKSPPKASQLKDSMDLYEEIVTEEQRSKESSYTELKSRFQAAQNQIKDLRRRLEQMEMQNTGLNTENCRLKKNISALLRTARQEVTRKDAEIQRLNQRSEKGHPHHHHHQHPPPPPPLLPSRLPTSPPRESQHPRDPAQSSRTESSGSASQPTGPCIERRASKASSHIHSKGSGRGDGDITDKQTEPSVSKFSSSSSTQHGDLDKHKSKHREEKYQNHKLYESTERRPRSGSYPSKDSHAPEKNRSHKADKDTGRKYDSRSGKSRIYPSVEGRHSSDRTRSPPPKISHSAASSDDMKGRSRERGREKAKPATSDSEQSTGCSKDSYSRDHRRTKTYDGHSRSSDSKDRKKSSSSQHAERSVDSSKEREGERLSKDNQRREERRHGDEISRKHRRNTAPKVSREGERERSRESSQGKVNDCSKERPEKTQEDLKRSSKEPHVTEKSSVEEPSPNRKLCFMETLNLTLSPIKKPTLPVSASQGDPTPVDKAVENPPDGENLQSHVEDMCVIEEADSSELEAGLDDVAGHSSDALKDSRSEKTQKKCVDDAKDVQEKDEGLSGTAGGKLEDSSVQVTAAHSQALHAAENQMHLAQTLPESSSPKATEGVIPNTLASESGSQLLEVTNSASSRVTSKRSAGNSAQKVNPETDPERPAAVSDPVTLESKADPPKIALKKSLPKGSFEEGAAAPPPRENPAVDDVPGSPKSKRVPPTVLPQDSQQAPHPPAAFSCTQRKESQPAEDAPKGTDAVSSTISLESLPQEGLSLPEAIFVLTQTSEEVDGGGGGATAEPSSSTGCIAVSKVSSTTEETASPPPPKHGGLHVTPRKSFPESKVEPSSPFPSLLDEDSMMCTLSNLKRIPDAISPLRSPIRIAKRSLLHVHGKPNHVKSLQKDFTSPAVDVNSKRLDVNKENKYPGSPANHDGQNMADKISDLRSSLSDAELEEGEILSESDEVAAGSPVPANKRAKLTQPVVNKPSPKSVLKRKSEEACVTSKETGEAPGASTRSPKSRFKTVCPAATKASFSNVEEIMETFKLVRAQIRKKYMKLHKTFPKKSFYGMMDNFQESFIEFVDGAHFGQICSQAGDLKSKLKKLIASVFGKVSNNGIVKRIFEQQAVDLKQKLWDFVDVQVDYLFKDVRTTLSSLCKSPPRAPAEDKRPGEGEKAPRPKPQTPQEAPPALPAPPAPPAPPALSRITPGAVVPYRTGLGSRGKDIRITHEEKDGCGDPDRPAPQTAGEPLPPRTVAATPEKNGVASLLDRTDFELLTEQQASSLTFNLVRDSQMGEIFRCLLQGSDLLEGGGVGVAAGGGDGGGAAAAAAAVWSLGTPRKDGERGAGLAATPLKFDSPSKLLSPGKFNTPSRLVATWAGISPRRASSPRPREHAPLGPALFDECCLLEVPSESRAGGAAAAASHRSYSILTEDLAVSLTIPSPLKSDSHLSFLQPPGARPMSTPDSVISAHISEDALMDGEDATEQDIHLALDTDNSSCGGSGGSGSGSRSGGGGGGTSFLFKPDGPMQALVMERSNDHFIVKIRQSSANVTLIADESLSRTLTEEGQEGGGEEEEEEEEEAEDRPHGKETEECGDSEASPSRSDAPSEEHLGANSGCFFMESPTRQGGKDGHAQKSPPRAPSAESQEVISPSETTATDSSPRHPAESSETNHLSRASTPHESDSERDGPQAPEGSRLAAEGASSTPEKDQEDGSRKRKKRQDKSKSKRPRKDGEAEAAESSKDDHEAGASPPCLSPNSLSAKNVVRKKGEVVIAWTRDEDRAILMDLKTKGASRDTFSALSEKLNKPSGEIAHRFHQLMKLFKRQEKMDT